MRIDLNQAASQITSENNAKPLDTENVVATDLANTGDRTTLTSTRQPLNELVRNAMSSPEIRQDRVDSLKQSIDNGTYELDPAKIASSMIDEQA
jgi:negative regulator of flagellin synthesis FlgM